METRIGAKLGDLVRLVLCVGVALMVMLPAAGFAQGGLKVGYVNLQQALNEVEEGKKAKKRLKAELKKRQAKLDKQQQKVKKLKSEFEAQASVMNEQARRAKAQELQKELMKLQQMYFGMQQELSKEEAKATKKIFDKMRDIIKKIAREKNYDLILEKNESVIYGSDKLDLTDELIKRFNKS